MHMLYTCRYNVLVYIHVVHGQCNGVTQIDIKLAGEAEAARVEGVHNNTSKCDMIFYVHVFYS